MLQPAAASMLYTFNAHLFLIYTYVELEKDASVFQNKFFYFYFFVFLLFFML